LYYRILRVYAITQGGGTDSMVKELLPIVITYTNWGWNCTGKTIWEPSV